MNYFFEPTKLAIKSNSNTVKKASSILLEHFNLNNFYYYKITDSGDFFLFDDNAGVVDFLDSQEFILRHPHYCHPKYHRNICQIEKTSDNPLLIGLETTQNFFLRSKFNLSISIVNKTEDAVEEFGFHSAQSDEEQSRFIFNHLSEIKLFTKWFLEKNRLLFSFLEENKINLPRLLGDVFYTNRLQEIDSIHLKREAFLKELGIEMKPNLSARELEVLKLTSKGFTPSQIGERIYRSKRTIEHCIESLKHKLSCYSKVELIEKARELENLFTH